MVKKRTEPPFRYGDDYPWNPDLDHEETLRIMRQLGLEPAKTSTVRRSPRDAQAPSGVGEREEGARLKSDEG